MATAFAPAYFLKGVLSDVSGATIPKALIKPLRFHLIKLNAHYVENALTDVLHEALKAVTLLLTIKLVQDAENVLIAVLTMLTKS